MENSFEFGTLFYVHSMSGFLRLLRGPVRLARSTSSDGHDRAARSEHGWRDVGHGKKLGIRTHALG